MRDGHILRNVTTCSCCSLALFQSFLPLSPTHLLIDCRDCRTSRPPVNSWREQMKSRQRWKRLQWKEKRKRTRRVLAENGNGSGKEEGGRREIRHGKGSRADFRPERHVQSTYTSMYEKSCIHLLMGVGFKIIIERWISRVGLHQALVISPAETVFTLFHLFCEGHTHKQPASHWATEGLQCNNHSDLFVCEKETATESLSLKSLMLPSGSANSTSK